MVTHVVTRDAKLIWSAVGGVRVTRGDVASDRVLTEGRTTAEPEQGVREKSRALFMNAKASNFTAPAYGATSRRLCIERGIEILLEHDLLEIGPEARKLGERRQVHA